MAERGDKPGRRPRPKGVQTLGNFTIRARPDLRDKLTEAARVAQRTMSEEINERLQDTFSYEFFYNMMKRRGHMFDLMKSIDEVVKSAQSASMARGYDEAETREALRAAIETTTKIYLWTPEVNIPEHKSGRLNDLTPEQLGQKSALETLIWTGSLSGDDNDPISRLDVVPLARVWSRDK